MKTVVLNLPTLAFVVVTRAALAGGIALLMSDTLPARRRRAIGVALAAVGAATTIPAAVSVIRSLYRSRQLITLEDPTVAKGRSTNQQKIDHSNEYMRGGKGRKDDVRGSRIYPASSPEAPDDATVRVAGEFVKHRGPKPKGFNRAI